MKKTLLKACLGALAGTTALAGTVDIGSPIEKYKVTCNMEETINRKVYIEYDHGNVTYSLDGESATGKAYAAMTGAEAIAMGQSEFKEFLKTNGVEDVEALHIVWLEGRGASAVVFFRIQTSSGSIRNLIAYDNVAHNCFETEN